MVDQKTQEKGVIESFYSKHESLLCLIGMMIVIIIPEIYVSLFITQFIIELSIIIWVTTISFALIISFVLSKEYCSNCKEFIHPVFSKHICEFNFKDKRSKIKNTILNILKQDFKQVDLITTDIERHNIFKDEKEKKIFKKNMNSLQFFEYVGDFKYCMVVMGSIVEFLLKKYCKSKKIKPEDYRDPIGNFIPAKKKNFANFTQSAIKNDVLDQKNSWFIVQNNLRNFRNYVHIEKETKEEEIDVRWYEIIKPVFEKIIQSFRYKNY